MIALTSDKLTLIKMGFSMKDLVHQGLGQSTPKQITHLKGFAAPER
jgi:hypothetical protein